jgi:AcrR family transcriptional regulator
MAASEGLPHGPAFEDLTARARIRQAAIAEFAEHGYERATIRGIAATAGVSPGLLRHHFGSKQELREAVDAYVLQEIRRVNDEVQKDSERGDMGPSVLSRQAIRPFQGYLARALQDGSTIIAKMFDQLVDMTEEWLATADAQRADRPYADRRTRAAVFMAMVFGVPMMREHLSRVLGVDPFSDEGDQRIALALLDIYSHAVVTRELADSAYAVMADPARADGAKP